MISRSAKSLSWCGGLFYAAEKEAEAGVANLAKRGNKRRGALRGSPRGNLRASWVNKPLSCRDLGRFARLPAYWEVGGFFWGVVGVDTVWVAIGCPSRVGGASFGVFFLGFFTSRPRRSLFPIPNSMPRIAPAFQGGKFQTDPLPTGRYQTVMTRLGGSLLRVSRSLTRTSPREFNRANS